MQYQIQIIVAQVAAKTGDVAGNSARACALCHAARDWGADLIVFPELFVTGYPPEDLLLLPNLPQRLEVAKAELALATKENEQGKSIDMIIGAPTYAQGKIYNSAWYLRNGTLAQTYHKQQLPNYGVFDEKRYFVPGNRSLVINVRGTQLMLLVCEDLWDENIASSIDSTNPDLVVAINASPFENGKPEKRHTQVGKIAAAKQVAWLYANLYGAQDELVFDGASFCVDKQGKVVGRAREMAPQLWKVTYQDGEWKDVGLPPPDSGLDHNTRVFYALTQATAAYVQASHASGVLLGLSGGIDSALTLAIAVAALGAKKVTAVILPYIHTRDISVIDAHKQAELLGVKAIELPIHQAVDGVLASLDGHIDWKSKQGMLALQNIQARCRAQMLMAIANASKQLVLVTSNKSELATGYGTLYGDMAGAYAVLKDVDKQAVYALARWCNRDSEQIVTRIIERNPSAELAPDQLDSDSLPPYSLLDKLVRGYVEQRQSFAQLCQLADAELVHKVISSIDRNEYKRYQAPMGPKITALAFGRDRRMPVTSYWQHKTPH